MKTLLISILLCTSFAWAAATVSPYAGQQNREIKSLSEAEIAGYLEGSGMGYAKAAELNGYPGPKHVLELAEEIGLSKEQMRQSEQLFDSMKQKATQLGHMLVIKERELNEAFAGNTITATHLKDLLEEIALLEGEIRYIHLKAHLDQTKLLQKSQAHQYVLLRGYDKGHHGMKHE